MVVAKIALAVALSIYVIYLLIALIRKFQNQDSYDWVDSSVSAKLYTNELSEAEHKEYRQGLRIIAKEENLKSAAELDAHLDRQRDAAVKRLKDKL